MKTGCVFSLSLLPQMYMMERISRSETVLVPSHHVVGQQNPINKCKIRTATDRIWALTVPLVEENLPADKSRVAPMLSWRKYILKDVAKAYNGLLFASEAQGMVERCIAKENSPWLVDVLLDGFMNILKELGWEREIIRGDSLQRRRYKDESEFLLNLALEADLDCLIVGHHQMRYQLDRRLFQRNGVGLSTQFWQRPAILGETDSFLDAVARVGVAQAKAMF